VAARKSQNLARDLQSGLSYAESKIAAVKSKNPLVSLAGSSPELQEKSSGQQKNPRRGFEARQTRQI